VTGLCAWCDGPIPAKARRDARSCSVRCPGPAQVRSCRSATPTRLLLAIRSDLRTPIPYPGQSVAVQGSPGLRRGS